MGRFLSDIFSARLQSCWLTVSRTSRISGEVIILLQGQFQFRIGHGDTNQYEHHQFDACKMGIIALQLSAHKCHALKNIGKNTNWFASYYLKSKEITKPPVDKEGCKKMLLT
ncbi:unnamed protein product [Adineta steineri]|uniref:Uncharacterized protein n=1 Tax=Adineta steineri TaxID=433720 RepID=A0A818GSE1_9BILA|nr:unnamed protein product [Adineta steineri]CAF3493296.1 unnamed protein product [Adineta steineri]